MKYLADWLVVRYIQQDADYDAVDWNDYWDEQIDRDEEERWFDEEEEGE